MNSPEWKLVRNLAIVLGLLIVAPTSLLLTVHLVEYYRGREAWEAYVTEARAKGRKLELRELLSPPIPRDQNYAATPLFEEAFAASVAGKKAPRPLDFPESGLELPSLGSISEPSLADLKGWSEHFLKLKLIDATSDDPAADVLRGLERYGPRLEELRRAGEKPAARFPAEWERGIAVALPHMPAVQQAAKLLSLRAMAHLAKGNSEAAYLDVQDGLRLSKALRGEPTLLSSLVRLNILQTVSQTIWQGLASDRWTEAELIHWERELRAFDLIEDLRFALSSERAMDNSLFDELMRMPAHQIGSLFGDAPPLSRTLGAIVAISYPRGWIRQNQILINQVLDHAEDRADAIAREGVAKVYEKPDFAESLEGTPLRRKYYAIANLVMPMTDTLEGKYVLASVRLEQAITACALQRYRNARGQYPAALSELVPKYISAVPRDLFIGSPMQYRVTGDGRFILWSVGQNRIDENGKTIPGRSDSKQPDLVWQYPVIR